ncbi:MAG: hypothetical protein KKD00_10000, partial [Gammaproteobacteria bacterium]|nr:hypothetical protein [Gammaproteobacteria bacterium]
MAATLRGAAGAAPKIAPGNFVFAKHFLPPTKCRQGQCAIRFPAGLLSATAADTTEHREWFATPDQSGRAYPWGR